jgi:MYXO-CTERM domain-containing protein
MLTKLLTVGALAALAVLPLTEQPARACGGCFRPQQVVSAVNAHRMVFSVSPTQTILWDQFSYSGDPQDFAWVLPVHAASVKVELAHDEFISALDAWTSPVIRGPQNSGGGGFGCASNAALPGPGGGGVQVINQEVVGPYEVATLRSSDPNALDNWLTSHGYDIPSSIVPTIAAYVSEGFDFIALRLVPGQGVAAMQPVRVVTQGADPTLPLRMVAAGIGSDVSILLFVISEGRYQAANFDNTEVDFSKLQWNKNLAQSNYDTLVQDAMTSGDGRNFTVEFAGHLNASDPFSTSYFRQPFKDVYYQGAVSSQKCPYTEIHGDDFPSDAGVSPGTDAGDDASADAGDDASGDAGADAAASDGGAQGDGGTLAAPYDACFFDDLTAATAGMNPSDVFVTRLRADLKASALDQDLKLQAAPDQSPYDNVHDATSSGDGCSTSDAPPDRGFLLAAFGALGALWLSRRRRRA